MRQPDDAERGLGHPGPRTSDAAMRATSAWATASFDCGGQASTPSAVTICTVLRSPPMTPDSADTSLATIQSQPLRRELGLGVRDEVIGLGGKSDNQSRPAGFAVRDRRQDVGILNQPQFRRAAVLLLDLAGVGLARRANRRPRRQTPLHRPAALWSLRSSISRAVSTLTTFTPAGSGRLTGPDTSVTSAPAAAAAAAMAWPCLPDERLAM